MLVNDVSVVMTSVTAGAVIVVVVETAVDASVVELQASARLSATHASSAAGCDLPGDRFATCPGCGSGKTSRNQ